MTDRPLRPRVIGEVAELGEQFIPATREVSIGRGVVYRPIRSWHSGVLAGEGITRVHGDGSGGLKPPPHAAGDYYLAPRPATYTHRFYWNVRKPEEKLSAFLSYPWGMGAQDEYFWEANFSDSPTGTITRWTGDDAEAQMEAAVLRHIGDPGEELAPAPPTAREVTPEILAECLFGMTMQELGVVTEGWYAQGESEVAIWMHRAAAFLNELGEQGLSFNERQEGAVAIRLAFCRFDGPKGTPSSGG